MTAVDRIKDFRGALLLVGLVFVVGVYPLTILSAAMALQAIVYPQHIGHPWGDVAALFVVAGILAFLVPPAGASSGQPAT